LASLTPSQAIRGLKNLAKRAPVARVYAEAHRLRRLNAGQARDIASITDRNDELVEELLGLRAKVDALTAEVRELRTLDKPLHVFWPVRTEDLLALDSGNAPAARPSRRHQPPYLFNWVLPPMGPASGGHVDIFRTIAYLESRGHRCRVYFDDPLNGGSLEGVEAAMTGYPSIQADLHYNATTMEPCDAAFATSWHTAYPLRRFVDAAKRFYYVQDFEPYFEAAGTYSNLAANTYRFGFHGLTLGTWLADKLSGEYDMKCDAFDFGVDGEQYMLRNPQPRRKVMFYARPTSARRGFELGVLALEHFHGLHPECEIEMVGGDIDRYELPFPCNRNGVLTVDQLCELYNQCAAGLVVSFTNMSLLPLEMLACGCTPVTNDSPNTRFVEYAEKLRFAQATPIALAEALAAAAEASSEPAPIQDAASYAKRFTWEDSNSSVEQVLLRELGSADGQRPAQLS